MHKLLSRVKRAEFVMPSHISDSARHLIQRMLTKDPASRITLTEIRQHSWFRKVPVDHYMFALSPVKVRLDACAERLVQDLKDGWGTGGGDGGG